MKYVCDVCGWEYDEELGYPEFNIDKKSKKNARNLTTGLKPLKTYASLLQKNSHAIIEGVAIQRNALPLFAYFTTEDIHTVRKFDKAKTKTYFKKYKKLCCIVVEIQYNICYN